MAFEWNRIHKSEEYLERIINELVFEQVTEHYAVDSIDELTRDQPLPLPQLACDLL